MNNFNQPTNSTNARTLKSTLIAASIGVLFTSTTFADDSLAAFSTAAAKYSQKTSAGFMSQVMCQHFSGHKVTQLSAEFRNLRETNSH